MIFGIKLNTPEDVQQLNRHATRFDFDMFVHGKTKQEFIDAKSLLGLMSLANKDGLKLVVPDHANETYVCKGIKNLLA